jgi:hypothetical protein
MLHIPRPILIHGSPGERPTLIDPYPFDKFWLPFTNAEGDKLQGEALWERRFDPAVLVWAVFRPEPWAHVSWRRGTWSGDWVSAARVREILTEVKAKDLPPHFKDLPEHFQKQLDADFDRENSGPKPGQFDWRGNVCEDLTVLEYNLLAYLWDNGRQRTKVSFEEARVNVWGSAVSSKGIASFVSRLNTKLSCKSYPCGIHLGLSTSAHVIHCSWGQ